MSVLRTRFVYNGPSSLLPLGWFRAVPVDGVFEWESEADREGPRWNLLEETLIESSSSGEEL